jgi:hypothetical protein
LNATIADREAVLTPPPGPSRPPYDDGDRHLALLYIAGGLTSFAMEARAAADPRRDHAADAAAVAAAAGDEGIAPRLAVIFAATAAGEAASAARLAAAMADLERDGWTRESACAALGIPEPRKGAGA